MAIDDFLDSVLYFFPTGKTQRISPCRLRYRQGVPGVHSCLTLAWIAQYKLRPAFVYQSCRTTTDDPATSAVTTVAVIPADVAGAGARVAGGGGGGGVGVGVVVVHAASCHVLLPQFLNGRSVNAFGSVQSRLPPASTFCTQSRYDQPSSQLSPAGSNAPE